MTWDIKSMGRHKQMVVNYLYRNVYKQVINMKPTGEYQKGDVMLR